jgi:predicted dehydrogenase
MKTKRALLVGAGSMGRTWAANLSNCPETEIAGWIDRDPQAVEASLAATEIEVAFKGTDLSHALDAIKPDFLVDVTTPESHCAVTLAALDRGIPVLGEKPMASTMEEAQKMTRASQEKGVLYMVSQSRRYDWRIRACRRAFQKIGDIGILDADFYLGPHFGGFRDAMESPLIVDMAIHTFDQARYLTGADPVSVYCEEFNPSWSWYKGDASAVALFEMENGLRFTYRGSWCAEGRNTWDGDQDIRGEVVRSAGGFMSEHDAFAEPVTDAGPVFIAGSLRDFLDALENPGHTPMGRCDDNIKSFAMVCAAVESSKTGRRVPIKLDAS